MTSTTTIRVSRDVRDRLNAQAGARGISVAALVDELSRSNDAAVLFATERALWLREQSTSVGRSEANDWDDASEDGID